MRNDKTKQKAIKTLFSLFIQILVRPSLAKEYIKLKTFKFLLES